MWSKITGKSSDASSHDGRRKEHGSSSSRRRAESIVSSATSRNPSSRVEDRSDYPPTLSSRSLSYPPPPSVSSIGSYATARDYDLRSERTAPSRSGLDDDDLRSVRSEKRRDDDLRSTRSDRHRDDDLRSERSERRRDRSSSRDRKRDRKDGDREHKKKEKRDSKDSKDKRDKDKEESGKKSKTRTRSGSKLSEIVDEPARPRVGDVSARSSAAYDLPMASPTVSQYATQYGPSSAPQTPHGFERMDAHVASQFPGQDPATGFSDPYRPPLSAQDGRTGLASDYYGDQGQSVQYQPGIRPDQPSVIVGAEPHLMSASAAPNPPTETGHGAASEYYGAPIGSQTPTTNGERPPLKPPRPQSMPGSFEQDPPIKPPRPHEKQSKISTAAAAAGGAALGYALGHDSSSSYQGSSSHHTNIHHNSNSTSFYQQSSNHRIGDPYYAPTSTAGTSTYIHSTSEPVLPAYAQSATSKPGKSGKHPSHSNAGLYAAGAAGLAAGAYGLHEHHHSHQHTHLGQNGAYYPSQPPSYSGLGMSMRHKQRGPVDKLVDWWKDHEDVRKMEEYTEYIGVCRHCFDPSEPPTMAPRKHHYHPHRRSSGSLRHSRIDKSSRYGYSSSDDEHKSKSHSWVAKGLAGYGIAKVGKALWWQNQDFDDTYSAKSGRRHRSSRSSFGARSRSRSRDRRSVTSRGVVRQRSRSRDSRVSRGYTGDKKDYKTAHRRSDSRSRSRDRKSGLFTAAAGAALGASVASAARHRSRSRSRSPRPGYVVRKHHNEGPSSSASFFGAGEKEHRHNSRHSVISSASHYDGTRSHRSSKENTGGVFGGMFSSAPSSSGKRRKSHTKINKGFFNFANSSGSSTDSGLAFGGSTLSRRSSTLSRRNSGRKKRRDSDEKLNAALVGLGATAAALAATQGRDKHHGKRRPELVAVREGKGKVHSARHSSERTRMPGSFIGSGSDDDEEGWESASDDESDTESMDSGLAFGDFGPRSRKSVESLRSDVSGTNKWSWRWGSKKDKQKRKSQDSLRAGAGLAGAGIVGAGLGAAASDARSSASSVPTSLQTVYPVATSDPTAFEAVRRSASVSSQQQGQYGQPYIASRPDPVPLQQPQPIMPVSNAPVYTTQAAWAPTPTYTAPSGPPVFSNGLGNKAPPTSFPGQPGHSEFDEMRPVPPRRANSSPIHSSTKRDLAIAGAAAAATAGVIAAAHSGSSSTSKRRTSSPPVAGKRTGSPSSVRFDLTDDQRERDDKERRKELKRKEEDRAERERERERERQRERELQLERERELERQREYERLRRVEEETRIEERRQKEQADREVAARREAEEAQARERARQEAEDKANLDRETQRILRERAEAAEAAAAREVAAREEMERRRLEHEAATRARERLEREIYEHEFNRKREEEEEARRQQEREEKLNYDIESRHRELRERERDVVEPEEHSWKGPAVAAAAGIAAGAAVAGMAHSSDDKHRDDKRSSKIEFDDDHLYEDEIMDPNYFRKRDKSQDTSRDASRERENGIARNAAKKVIADMEERWKDPKSKQNMEDFWAPPELRDRSPSRVDHGPDADVQVYHSPYVVVQPPYDPAYNFTATRDGHDHKASRYASVPTLNLIEPTPPVSLAGSMRGDHSGPPSPNIQAQKDIVESPKSTTGEGKEREKEKEKEERQRKRTSVTWGADETFHYEAQTPESFREHYMSEHDMKRHLPEDWVYQRNQSYSGHQSHQDNDEIVLERDSPRSGTERVSYRHGPEERSRGWGPDTESPVEEIKRFEHDDRPVIESTSPEHTPTIVTPGEQEAQFRQSPFFEAAPNFQAFDVSPGAEPDRGQHGFVEEIGEEPVEEIIASKPRESEPHMPGAWDDDEPQKEPDSSWAEPKLSKKEQKKRDKANKRASLDAQAEAARLAEDVASSTGSLKDLDKEARRGSDPVIEETAWEAPLSKKEKKKREKEAAKRASLEAEAKTIAGVEEPVVQPEAEWEAPLSKKEQKKRDKAAKRATLGRDDPSSLPSTPAEEPKVEDLWEDAPSSKKDKKKKKRESIDRDPRDIEPGYAYSPVSGEKGKDSREAKSDYGVPPSRMPDVMDDKARRRSLDAGNHSSYAAPLGFAAAAGILAGGLSDSKRKEAEPDSPYSATSPSQQMPRAPSPPSSSAPYPTYSNGDHSSAPDVYPVESPARSIPSTAFHDYDELADAKQPSKKSKRRSRLGSSPSPGSPLRTEVAFNDYIGMDAAAAAAAATAPSLSKSSSETYDAANVPLPKDESPPWSPTGEKSSKKKHYVYEEPEEFPISSGVSLPIDPYCSPHPRDETVRSPERDEYPERGYAWEDEGERKKHRHHRRRTSEDPDNRSVGSDDRDSEGRRKHRHHRRRESERSDGTYDDTRSTVSDGRYDEDGHRKHKHRKHRSTGDDDSKSVVSEFRDDEDDERKKHKHRRSKRESEIFEDSLHDRDARSEPGDLDRDDPERRKHKRRSKREGDFDDTASVVSSPAKYYDDDKKKDKDKEKKGIFSSLFGKSKENVAETSSSKSHDKSRDDDDGEEHKHRRRKHRSSTHGSSYGSDDDSRSVVSSASGRREKRHSGSRDDSGMDYSRHYKVHTTAFEQIPSLSSTSIRRLQDDNFPSAPVNSSIFDDSQPVSSDTAGVIDDRIEELMLNDFSTKDDITTDDTARSSKRNSYHGSESFLGLRARGEQSDRPFPPLPTTTKIEISPAHLEHHDELEEAIPIFTPLPRSRSTSPADDILGETPALPRSRPTSPDPTATPILGGRRSTPSLQNMRKTSATAVPISFRGFGPRAGSDVGSPASASARPASTTAIPIPFLAQHGRRASTGAHNTSAPPRSPVSPQHGPTPSTEPIGTVATPPPKHKKAPSTEFKGGQFRPLYLVERTASAKRRGSEETVEALPVLPASRSPSVSQESGGEEWASAVEDEGGETGTSGYASAAEEVSSGEDVMRDRGLRIDTGLASAPAPAGGEDWLGSQQSTPKAGVFSSAPVENPALSGGVDVPRAAAEKLEREGEESHRFGDFAAAAALVGGAAAAGFAAKELFKGRDEEEKMHEKQPSSRELGEKEVALPTTVEESVADKNTILSAFVEDHTPTTPTVATAEEAKLLAHAPASEQSSTTAAGVNEFQPSVPAPEQEPATSIAHPVAVEKAERSAPLDEPTTFPPPAIVEEPRPTSPHAPVEEPTTNILDNFMAGEPDNDAIEEARLAAEADRQRQEQEDGAEQPSTPSRPALLTRTSSKKSKKKQKAGKLGTIAPEEHVDSDAAQLTLEQAREAKRRDTEDAIEGWFVDEPTTAAPLVESPVDGGEATKEVVGEDLKKSETQTTPTPSPAIPSALLARDAKGKKKKDKKKKSKNRPISEVVAPEAPAELSRELDASEPTVVEAEPAVDADVQPLSQSAEVFQEEPLVSQPAEEEQVVPAAFMEETNVPIPTEDVPAATGEEPKNDISAPVIPEANPEDEFAPVVSSSKKKKKGKKGKKGSVSSSGIATPVEVEKELPGKEEVVERERLGSPQPTTEQPIPDIVPQDVPVVPVLDERGVHGVLEEGGDDITAAAVQPAEEGAAALPNTAEFAPVEEMSTAEPEPAAVVEAVSEDEFVAVPAKGKKKKKEKKDRKSVDVSPPVEEALVAPAAEAISEQHPVVSETQREVVAEPQTTMQEEPSLPDTESNRDLVEPLADERLPELATSVQPPTDTTPVEPIISETRRDIVSEQQTTAEEPSSLEATAVPLPGLAGDRDLTEPQAEELREVPEQTDVVQQLQSAPADEPDPDAEFAVVPSKKNKKKDKKKSVQEDAVLEAVVPAVTEKNILPEPSAYAVVEEIQEARPGVDVPLPDDGSRGLVDQQLPTFEMPEDERQEFMEDEEAMKIEQTPATGEFSTAEVSEPAIPAIDAPEVPYGPEQQPEITAEPEDVDESFVSAQESVPIPVPEMTIEQEMPAQELDTTKASETADPIIDASEVVAGLSKEPEPLAKSEEVGETSIPEQEPVSTTLPETQPEDEWAVQPKKKKKGKKGKKVKASGQSSVDITEPSTPAPESVEPDTTALSQDTPRDAGAFEAHDVPAAYEPSAELLETAISTGELPETTMAAAGLAEGFETPMQQDAVGGEHSRSVVEDSTPAGQSTSVTPFTRIEEERPSQDVGETLPTPHALAEDAAQIPLPSTTDEPTMSLEPGATSVTDQIHDAPVEGSLKPAELELPKDEAVLEQTTGQNQEVPLSVAEPEESKADVVERVEAQSQEEPHIAPEAQPTAQTEDIIAEELRTGRQDVLTPTPEIQPEDEWAIPSKSKKKNKKKKRGSSAQTPIQVESPVPGSPKLEASTAEDTATVAPPPMQVEAPGSVDLTQPAAENFDAAREITPVATDQPADVTDDLRGPAPPAAAPTSVVSEENPSNPTADISRDETPPYAGEWELPTQSKQKGKKGKKRDVGSTGEQSQVEEADVPTDEQIASSAVPLAEADDSVPVVEHPVDALTEDHIASSAHHPSLTPPAPPQQFEVAEETPRSGFEPGVEHLGSQPVESAPVVEEQQQVGADTFAAAPEDDWSFMPPKKNKKGKKGKKQDSISSTPKEVEHVPETVVEPTSESHADESAPLENLPVEEQSQELKAASEEPVTPAEAGEDEWALLAKKKKGKKGKKGFADVVQDAVQLKDESIVPEQQVPEQALESDLKVEDDASKSLDSSDVVAGETAREVVVEPEPTDAAKIEDVAPTSEELPQDLRGDDKITDTEEVITEEPAVVEVASDQPKEADAEDIWSSPTSSKKAKKKKKGKQMSVEEPPATPEIEPSPVVEESSRDLPFEEPVVTDVQQPETISSEPQPGISVEPTTTEPDIAGEVNAEDEWAAAPSSKKSKKKKGKKGKQDSVSETPPILEEEKEEQVPEVKEDEAVLAEPQQLDVTEPAIEQSADKAALIEPLVVQEAPEAPVVAEPLESAVDEDPTREAVPSEPVVAEISVGDAPQEAGEGEWALSGKKKKKGKKGKRTPVPSTPLVVEEPVPFVEEPSAVVTAPVADESLPFTEEPTTTIEEPTPAVEEPASIFEEPTPIISTTQDDKSLPIEEPKVPADVQESEDVPESVQLVKEETFLPTEDEAQRAVEEPLSNAESTVTESTPDADATTTQPAPEEAKPEDTWEVLPSKKKGKKGKKGKQQSISTPPAETLETQPEPKEPTETQLDDTPKESDAAAPIEAVHDEEFSMPLSKKDKKKKKKAAAAAALPTAWIDDTPETQTASPAEETPVVEDKSRSLEQSERIAPSISFAAAAGILADAIADSKRKEADSESLFAAPRSPKIESEGPLAIRDKESSHLDQTVVQEPIVPDSAKEAVLEETSETAGIPKPPTQDISHPEPPTEGVRELEFVELQDELLEHKDKDISSLPKSLGFAAAAGILADAVADSRRKESSPGRLKSTDVVSEDVPSGDKEISTEQSAQEPVVETAPMENVQPAEEADPFAEFAPVKKGKKNKKKGRKSVGTATPSTEEPIPEEKETSAEPVVEATPVMEETIPEGKPVENEPASQEQTREIKEPVPAIEEKRSGSPSQDVEFAAALAAGLQDSGFDPGLVLNDPTFHERKSPPGSALEPDPDDLLAPVKPKKNKKKKRGLATPDVEGEPSETVTPDPTSVKSPDNAPAPTKQKSQESPSQEVPDQDATFTAALSSVLDDPTFNRRTPSPDARKEAVSDEFFPFQKRPKKKKGKKSQDTNTDSDSAERQLSESIEQPTPIMDTPQEEATHMNLEPQVTAPTEEPISTDQPAIDAEPPKDIATKETQPLQEQEDEWSFTPSSKKKGKKGKKGKKAALAENEEEAPAVTTDDTTRSAAVDSPAVEAPTDVPTAVENPVTETSVEEQARESSDPLETGAIEKDGVPDTVAEGEWAVPMRKKSKKGKKGKKGAIEEPVQQNPVEETVAPISLEPATSSWADQMKAEEAPTEVPAESGSLVKMLEQQGGDLEEKPKEASPMQQGWEFPWQNQNKERKRMSLQEMAEQAAMPADEMAIDGKTEEQQREVEEPADVGTTREISTAHEKPKHELPSPTESHSSKIANLFPGLQRVKRKVPPPKESEIRTEDRLQQKDSRSSLLSGHGSRESLSRGSRSPLNRERSRSVKSDKEHGEPSRALGGLGAVMQPTWGFPPEPPNRDSAVTMNDTPVIPSEPVFHDMVRDSGFHDGDLPGTPIDDEQQVSPPEPMRVDVETTPGWDTSVTHGQSTDDVTTRDVNDRTPPSETPVEQDSPQLPDASTAQGTTYSSPVESLTTTRARSSRLFESSPSVGSVLDTPLKQPDTPAYPRSLASSPPTASWEVPREVPPSLFGDPTQQSAEKAQPSTTPSRHLRSPSIPLEPISEHSPDESPLSKKGRPLSDVGMPDHGVKSLRRSFGSNKSLRDQMQSSPGHPEEDQGTVVNIKNPSHVFRQTEKDGGRQRAGSIGDPFIDKQRSPSVVSDRSIGSHTSSIFARIKTPEHIRPNSTISNRSATPPLRRVDRAVSGDLRAASQLAEARAHHAKSPATSATIASPTQAGPSTYDRVRDKGKARAPDMSEQYVSSRDAANDDFQILTVSQEGWGDAPGTPLSPTRPPSVRKRQSIHIMDLETRLDQLASENRLLQEAKARAEEAMQDANINQDRQVTEAVEARDAQIRAKDAEIAQISEMLHNLRQEIARLSEVNASLAEANQNLTNDTNQRYATLQAETQHAQSKWQESERALEHLRQQHSTLSTGMEEVVRQEIKNALKDKDAELRRLHDELADATQQVKSLQRQILESKEGDSFLTVRDEDYFDSACQQLCQHVQQWVLRFSKFSDTRACRLSSDVKDEKIETRLDNAILDGTDVDMLLADRVRRRDVFMSVVMTMIWEYVFTRYLFGMDREQRQKLKALEKTLTDVGPPRAVAQWRAITLTLLSKREPFQHQRSQDTEAVVQEIFGTLASLLPPPSHLADKIQESLRNVLRLAVDLSIEMRTQRAEYIMLPPLQPEYDTNGDLVRKVYFNSSLMNERSGETTSNEELESNRAVVKIVLFPLVVKKGDDFGEGEDEIVVCPAQVLTAKPARDRKVVRVLSGAMEIGDETGGRRSVQSRSSLSRVPGSVLPEGSAMDTTF